MAARSMERSDNREDHEHVGQMDLIAEAARRPEAR